MLHTHSRQQLQRKGEAERTLIDPVDENLGVDMRAVGLQQSGEVLVGHLPVNPCLFDDGLCRLGVKVPGTLAIAYIVFHLRASYRLALDWRPINGFPFKAKTDDVGHLDVLRGLCLSCPGENP